MTTTDTRILFSRTDLVAKFNNPKTLHILSQIDGFEEIRTSAQRCTQIAEPPVKPDQFATADRLLAGENLTELANEYATTNRAWNDFSDASGYILNSARTKHDQKVEDFARIHEREMQAGLLRELNRIKTEAQKLLPQLRDVTTAADLVGRPDAAHAFSRYTEIISEFDSWRSFHSHYFGIIKLGVNAHTVNFADADILAKLELAWPDFHHSLVRYDSNNSATRGTSTPWATSDALLREIADRDLQLWAPTAAELETERQRLRELAEPRAKDEAKRRLEGRR